MRSLRLTLLVALAGLVAATPAMASAWHSYSIYNGKAAVEGGSGTHSARLTSIVLPDSFKVRERATKLTFGPIGSCRSTGVLAPVLVQSTAKSAAAVLGEQLAGGTTYGEGTHGDAVYRVAKFQNGALKGVYVRATPLAQTWIVVRATTTPHGMCHIGGVRESLGIPLGDAFGTIRASGY